MDSIRARATTAEDEVGGCEVGADEKGAFVTHAAGGGSGTRNEVGASALSGGGSSTACAAGGVPTEVRVFHSFGCMSVCRAVSSEREAASNRRCVA